MKIVSWNLKNIGDNKLNNPFSPIFNAFGLGNNVIDYITGLVMGNPCWNAVPNLSTNPADIFVVIELKTGGSQKGKAISGTCLPTLNNIKAKLNTLAKKNYSNNQNPTYEYDYIVPQITGYHETVGILFNTKKLKVLSAQAFRNNTTQNWINPRTPYGAKFQVLNSTDSFQVVGIHAPPPKGADGVKYRPPINYCTILPTIELATMNNTFIMGDFNCNPASYYNKEQVGGQQVQVFPFTPGLATYITLIPNGTLSSVRTKPANSMQPPANYLSDAYDNIIYNTVLQNGQELVVDLIGKARNMNANNTLLAGTNLLALVNAYNIVSDHLPVVIEW
ncbi:hypothetical protein [Chitinophaga sp. LS1]|uniref:hypothetical protein n=1 Tax=Chitinophaga sp. LS1 TaxID=3051176 RepID=UPI002AAA9C3B|nr:hypothetical protein [Chitinophaga sp. LS1]WPV64835.1 hypothetical protein QQL36_23820 [Chitinophaga sp. LS1]